MTVSRADRRLVRGLAFVIAVLMTVVAGSPLALAQSQGNLTPPHTDQGIDTDAPPDGLFNYLRVSVNFDATVAGDFVVAVDLYDNSGTFGITNAFAFVTASGPATVDVDLDGVAIRSSGFDGPYQANLYLFDDAFNLDDFGVYMTQAYFATDFQTPPMAFAPPHSDQGIDTDGDMLFNYLRVTASVNVQNAGVFDFYVDLYDQFFNYLGSGSAPGVGLGPGMQAVDLDIPGYSIQQNGVNGPYLAQLYAYDSFSGAPLDSDTHMTQAYLAGAFDPPPATFAPPHSDQGIDTDLNGKFDEIAVDLQVDVTEAGDYYIVADLLDSTFTFYFGSDSATVSLSPGIQRVRLTFSTLPMVVQGIPGPYEVNAGLYPLSGPLMDQDIHETQPYLLADFDPVPAAFNPPHSDAGIDRDVPPDGEFNVLEVNVGVDVAEAGGFIVLANLWDLGMTVNIASELRLVTLAQGPQVVPVDFSGIAIRNSAIDGPYTVELLLAVLVDGSPVFIDTDTYTTSAYTSTQFQSTTPAPLSGTVRDILTTSGIPFASIVAYDYTNYQVVSGNADMTGAYSLPLYDGNWVVTYDAGPYQTQLARVTVSGPTTADADLYPSVPDLLSIDVGMGTWNTASIQEQITLQADNQTFRQYFDWYFGDRDQVLSQAEFDAFLDLIGFTPPVPPPTTDGFFYVNGAAYDYVPGSETFQWVNVAGPIDTSTPFGFVLQMAFENASIAPSAAYTVQLNVTYDSPYQMSLYTIALPSGYTATSYTASPLVAVSGMGTGLVTMNPEVDPDPFDAIYGESVSVSTMTTDATNPTVSVTDAPDPVVIGSPWTANASASDDNAISSVQIQIRDPSGTVVEDTPMTYAGGTYYEHRFSPTAVGFHTYTVTAMDLAGNFATSGGSFRAIELTPPTVASASATPSPQEFGQPVLISASVTDNTAVDHVSVEVRNPAGGPLGNFTMTYNSTSSRWETTQTFPALGTLSFTVWANDTSDNWASASGTFVIQDTTNPALTGVGATPDPAEFGAAVTISATATDLAGVATVRVEIRDPAGSVVGTFAMTDVGGGVWEYTYTPADLGTYTFTVTAVDASMNAATGTGSFASQDTTNPTASAGPDQTVQAGATVTFDGSASSDNHGVANWTWTFTEGGQTRTLYGASPTHTFAAAGTYDVTVRVTDASGNWAEDTVRVTVSEAPGGPVGGIGSWVWILLAIVIVAIVVAVFALRARRKPAEVPPGGPTQTEAPPVGPGEPGPPEPAQPPPPAG